MMSITLSFYILIVIIVLIVANSALSINTKPYYYQPLMLYKCLNTIHNDDETPVSVLISIVLGKFRWIGLGLGLGLGTWIGLDTHRCIDNI